MAREEWTATLEVRRAAARSHVPGLEAWDKLTFARRDAITRARAVFPEFDTAAEFELCTACQRPARDASGPLEPVEGLTCACRRAA